MCIPIKLKLERNQSHFFSLVFHFRSVFLVNFFISHNPSQLSLLWGGGGGGIGGFEFKSQL